MCACTVGREVHVRHGGLVAAVEHDGRAQGRAPHHRRHQCQPHHADEHQHAAVGPRPLQVRFPATASTEQKKKNKKRKEKRRRQKVGRKKEKRGKDCMKKDGGDVKQEAVVRGSNMSSLSRFFFCFLLFSGFLFFCFLFFLFIFPVFLLFSIV